MPLTPAVVLLHKRHVVNTSLLSNGFSPLIAPQDFKFLERVGEFVLFLLCWPWFQEEYCVALREGVTMKGKGFVFL